MKRNITIICAMLLAMNSISALAQESYPADIFCEEFEDPVIFKGKSPTISDFVTAFLNLDETSEVLGALDVVWNHYLRNEPQEPCDRFLLDEKNGYLLYTFDSQLCDDFDDVDEKGFYEMCYWNCADGKHKLVAENYVSMTDDMYYDGQYSGICFYLYVNDTRKLWQVSSMDLNAFVDERLDESAIDTGKQLTRSDEETVVVYRLPQQGKDIIVDICCGTRKSEVLLVWDGMRFHRQDKGK